MSAMAPPADLIPILLVLAVLVATINHRFIGLPRAIALLLLGALLAPTDVVIDALLRLAPIPSALKTAISGEVTAFWQVGDELLKALLFALIGLDLFAINLARVAFFPLVGGWPLAVFSRLVGVILPVPACAAADHSNGAASPF
jgi:NhaP-type Na+/H+ or K+/H+ antiporter